MPALKYWNGSSYVLLSSGISQADADTRYVNIAGDSMAGNLLMSSYRIRELDNPAVATDAANKQYVDSGNTAQTGWASGPINAGASAWHSDAVTLNLGTVAGIYLVMLECRAIAGATTHDFWTVVTSTSGSGGTAVLPQSNIMGQTKLLTRIGWWAHPGGPQTLYVSGGFASVACSATAVLQTVRVGGY